MSTITLVLDSRDRLQVATTVEQLIALLDAIDPDPDLEPYLGWPQQGVEALLPDLLADDREEENEYGGNIEDEPQEDANESAEDRRHLR